MSAGSDHGPAVGAANRNAGSCRQLDEFPFVSEAFASHLDPRAESDHFIWRTGRLISNIGSLPARCEGHLMACPASVLPSSWCALLSDGESTLTRETSTRRASPAPACTASAPSSSSLGSALRDGHGAVLVVDVICTGRQAPGEAGHFCFRSVSSSREPSSTSFQRCEEHDMKGSSTKILSTVHATRFAAIDTRRAGRQPKTKRKFKFPGARLW